MCGPGASGYHGVNITHRHINNYMRRGRGGGTEQVFLAPSGPMKYERES